MKYILFALVLIVFAAIGLTVGRGFGSFVCEDRFAQKKKSYLDEDPDIQTNMHGEE